MITEYVQRALRSARYDKLEDGFNVKKSTPIPDGHRRRKRGGGACPLSYYRFLPHVVGRFSVYLPRATEHSRCIAEPHAHSAQPAPAERAANVSHAVA